MRRPAFWRSLVGALLVLGFLAGTAQAQEPKSVYTLQVDGLACPFCAYGIEKQLSAIEGVESVQTDIKSGTVTVTMQEGVTLERDTARQAVEAAGFTMRELKRQGAGE
jgi:mercuric ion binding protein